LTLNSNDTISRMTAAINKIVLMPFLVMWTVMWTSFQVMSQQYKPCIFCQDKSASISMNLCIYTSGLTRLMDIDR